jgi:hypothetical protein
LSYKTLAGGNDDESGDELPQEIIDAFDGYPPQFVAEGLNGKADNDENSRPEGGRKRKREEEASSSGRPQRRRKQPDRLNL